MESSYVVCAQYFSSLLYTGIADKLSLLIKQIITLAVFTFNND